MVTQQSLGHLEAIDRCFREPCEDFVAAFAVQFDQRWIDCKAFGWKTGDVNSD